MKKFLGVILVLIGFVSVTSLSQNNQLSELPYQWLTLPLIPFLYVFVGISLFRKPSVDESGLKYADTLRRGFAMVVDGIIFTVPLIFIQNTLRQGDSFWLYATYSSVYFIIIILLDILFLARYGATPGKMLVKIKVISIDLGAIGWREAFLRNSISLALTIPSSIATFIGFTHVNASVLTSANWAESSMILMKSYPTWFFIFSAISQYWLWSELVVMAFNKKRRAIHDYLAGTLVVVESTIPLKDKIDENGVLSIGEAS